jgi:hypothetical protein
VRWLVPIVACAGCQWVYDAQYDDRATALEKSRSELLPGTDQVSFITATENKFFWVDLVKPLDDTMLHSFDPASGARIDYELTRRQSNIGQSYKMSDSLLVFCEFGLAIAYDASQGNSMIQMTDQGSQNCTVDGSDVYFDVNRKIMKWTPSTNALVQVVDLDTQASPVGTDDVGGMGVTGHQLLLEEGGRLWLMDLTTGVATWLENPPVTNGEIAFDATGVVFPTQQGVTRELFSGHTTQLLASLIADGGYEINFEHDDAQELGDFDEYSLTGSYLVYRGKHGIFAYGFSSTKVIDLLLDRGEGFDAKPIYHTPVVAGGSLFVQDTSDLSSDDQPVYQVPLSGRLP